MWMDGWMDGWIENPNFQNNYMEGPGSGTINNGTQIQNISVFW